jgi:hypothetical protein
MISAAQLVLVYLPFDDFVTSFSKLVVALVYLCSSNSAMIQGMH